MAFERLFFSQLISVCLNDRGLFLACNLLVEMMVKREKNFMAVRKFSGM